MKAARRVVITGIGLTTPIGNTLPEVVRALRCGRSGIRFMPEFGTIRGMRCQVAAPVTVDLDSLSKRRTRTMGRVSKLATWATKSAIADASLPAALLSSGRLGLAYGSTAGSLDASQDFITKLCIERSIEAVQSATYLKMMSHTCAANLAHYFAIRGRVITTCSACVSGSQAIGYAYEAIRHGHQDAMLAGGAEELHPLDAAVFDLLFAASSKYNDDPQATPRPFDSARDGLVVGEGASTVVLEELASARARGAPIHAEIVGFGTNCDGMHLTAPSEDGMAEVMHLALRDAELSAKQIDYVNAHATATLVGDAAESRAIAAVLGTKVPVSSTKGLTGHTLGACGAIETAFCVAMLKEGFLAANRNLDRPGDDIAPIALLRGAALESRPEYIMNNNFAFAGLNTALVIKRWDAGASY